MKDNIRLARMYAEQARESTSPLFVDGVIDGMRMSMRLLAVAILDICDEIEKKGEER